MNIGDEGMVEYRGGRDEGIQGRNGWWNTGEEGMVEYRGKRDGIIQGRNEWRKWWNTRGKGMVEYRGVRNGEYTEKEMDGGMQRSKEWGTQGRRGWGNTGEEEMWNTGKDFKEYREERMVNRGEEGMGWNTWGDERGRGEGTR